MARIVGAKSAKELALTRNGANQHAHITLRKSLTPSTPAAPANSGNPDMEITALKRVLMMNDVTKAHFIGLDDTASTAFLAKSVEDQDAEAATAKKALDDAAAVETAKTAATAAATGAGNEQIAALQKSVTALTGVVTNLTETLATKGLEETIAKRYASEFQGFPGGLAAITPVLKAAAAMPEDARLVVEKSLKTQAEIAKRSGFVFGEGVDETTLAKTAPATTKVNKEASERSTKKSISVPQALAEMAMEPGWGDDMAAAEAEQLGAS